MRRVYFIKPVGMDGPIKIGCSQSPQGRASNLETWSPFALEIVAEIEAGSDFQLEHRFHAKFAHLHQRREWFSAGPDLLCAIAEINAGTFDISSLPDPRRLDNVRRGRASAGRARYDRAGEPSATAYPLLREIIEFAKLHDMSLSRFGVDATGDPSLVAELSVGREPRAATIAKIRQFMAGHSALRAAA